MKEHGVTSRKTVLFFTVGKMTGGIRKNFTCRNKMTLLN